MKNVLPKVACTNQVFKSEHILVRYCFNKIIPLLSVMEKESVMINDFKARLIGIPLVGLLMAFIFDGKDFTGVNGYFFGEWAKAILFTLLFWQGNRAIFIYLRRRYPHYHQTRTRLIYEVGMAALFTFAASAVACYVLSLIGEECVSDNIFANFLIHLGPTSVIMLIYESVLFFEAWKNNVKKTEALARENVQSQLETLKNQLDPHFLFNSLNTLAALIDENKPAQEYLERLSDVYRYVLVSRDKNTVNLEEEMTFVDAYIYLNKVRFRENLQIEKQIPSEVYGRQIAPGGIFKCMMV